MMNSQVLGWSLAGAVWLCSLGCGSAGAQPVEAQPWQSVYAGDDATGPSVVGLWQFEPGAETQDVSGKGHELKLRGTGAFGKDGRFGGCLESCRPGDEGKLSGAEVLNSAGLSPAGAFTVEMWIKPKPEFDQDTKDAWLLDKMYVNYKHKDPKTECQRDYALTLGAATDGMRCLVAFLGFGDDMVRYTSRPARFEGGVWHHVAFSYDGAGTGTFYRDGEMIGGDAHLDRKAVTPGTRNIVIGDRFGSGYNGFPGWIDQVRICDRAVGFYSGTLSLAASGRTAFVRMEKDGKVDWTVTSNRGSATTGAVLVIAPEGGVETRLPVTTLDPGASQILTFPVATTGRPGQCMLKARVEGADGKPLSGEINAPLTLVPRPLPYRMPVTMWGGPDLFNEKLFQTMKHIGFTHSLSGPAVDYGKIWEAGKPTDADAPGSVERYRRTLDYALAHDHGVAAYPRPGPWIGRYGKEAEKFRRVGRDGKPYDGKAVEENPCGLLPGVIDFCYNAGASIAQSYGAYPGLQAALIHSEIRDSTQVCFHDVDRAGFRAFSGGKEIPEMVVSKSGVAYRGIKDFPVDRVVADDDLILQYYRWFWKQGDGWNQMHTALSKGLKSTGRSDIWTWFDPAVRVPSIWGSGGEVDYVSQWTYSYPDPIRIGLPTDELFAMAAGSPTPQSVLKLTQIIWYRTGTAPKPKPGEEANAPKASWMERLPDADFLTISPDHLREALWGMISRPVRGIMYHGWESLVEVGKKTGYCCTNPDTQEALAELTRDVIRPLGPTLLQVPDRQSEVGYLESFASQVFSGRGSWGWAADDNYLMLLYANLQPRVLYDETILRDGLGGLRVLVLTNCDVLTRSVAEKVKEFQRNGGLIVGDENLCPAITPDIRVTSYKRTSKADVDKAAVLAKAAALRQELDPFFRHWTDASSPDVVTRVRSYGTTDYVFAINDRREFGDYVGQWGLAMEKGLPNSATITLDRAEGFVYDLVAGKSVPAVANGGKLLVEAQFGPGEGKLYMVTERPIHAVKVMAPRKAELGDTVEVSVKVGAKWGKQLDAVIPVQVEILDPAGKPAEFSGYYGAKDGRIDIRLDLAANDATGDWKIRAKDLASGLTAEETLRVR